jgi:uncharacterized protein (DUF58 family)
VTTRWPTVRLTGYATLTVFGLVAALVIGRPEPAILATPFALFLALGLATAERTTTVEITAELDPPRIEEGDEAILRVAIVDGSGDGTGYEIRTTLPPGVEGDPTGTEQRVTASRWGAYRLGPVAVRTTDALRLFVTETQADPRAVLRVHPTATTLRRTIAAARLVRRVGIHTSGERGDGIEFADVRPFAPGDRARAVNWRASARRDGLWVNDRRPERSADVVLLLDTFGASGRDRIAALDLAVRALAAMAGSAHGARDRIGLLTFGGHLRWVAPGLGQRALLRVVEGLLDTEVLLSATWEGVTRVPTGALPPHALLLAATPLDNDTAVQTLLDLRARGFDVAVVGLPAADPADEPPLARRLRLLDRDRRRLQLERLGIAVALAARLDDLAQTIGEVEACRRRQRQVRV